MNEAQKELKKQLTEAFILKHSDFTKLFILYTDVNKKGINAILAQYDSEAKADYIVEYFSQNLGQAQKNCYHLYRSSSTSYLQNITKSQKT